MCVHKKTYGCDWPECDFVGSSARKLDIHKLSHEGLSPYVCDWPECGFNASNLYNLRHHKYRHPGERPYPCTWPGCGKTYAYFSSFFVVIQFNLNLNLVSEPLLLLKLMRDSISRTCAMRVFGPDVSLGHMTGLISGHNIRHRRGLIRTEDTNKRCEIIFSFNFLSK